MLRSCSNSNFIFEIMSTCNTCFHPCHCDEDRELHADEYGVCTCEGCKCDKSVDKTYENEVNKNNGG